MKNQVLNLNRRAITNCLLVVGVLATIIAGSFSNVQAQSAAVEGSPDFNNDGKADLAVGVPREDVGTSEAAGAVSVLYGTSSRLTSTGDQFWTQSTSGVEGTSEPFDLFGTSVASGDFNGDGESDLAIGVPSEAIGSIDGAGAVNVLYGSSSSGLTSSGDQFWSQNSNGILDSAEGGLPDGESNADNFGQAVVAGDFNGDGFSDLAIGVHGEDVNGVSDAGAVNVIYGSSSGLTSSGDQFWTQDSSGIESSAESDDHFGGVLAAGDFDGDGQVDLAIGVPNEGVGDKPQIGAVSVIFGSSSGLTSSGDQFWTQDSPGIADTAESNDEFGHALASGDLNGDGFADLAVGVPREDLPPSEEENPGAVNVIYGSSSGLTSTGNQFWNQDSSGIESGAETADLFGWSLAGGDFDGDSKSDLAVGVPGEDLSGISAIGAVNVIYGSSSGLTSTGNQFWTQNSPGIADSAEQDDDFGDSLGTGDYNGDGNTDLAIGVPGEDVSGIIQAGAVNVIYGSSSGLTSSGDQFWNQDSSGILNAAGEADFFGSSLSNEEASAQ
jgi:FG-GAP repeat protein